MGLTKKKLSVTISIIVLLAISTVTVSAQTPVCLATNYVSTTVPAGQELVMTVSAPYLNSGYQYLEIYTNYGVANVTGSIRCDGQTIFTETKPLSASGWAYFTLNNITCNSWFEIVFTTDATIDIDETVGLKNDGECPGQSQLYDVPFAIASPPVPPPVQPAEPAALSIDLSLIFQYASDIVSMMMPIVGVGAGISFGFALVAYIIRLFRHIF